MYDFTIELDTVPIGCSARFPETERFFGPWRSEREPLEGARVSQPAWDFWPSTGKPVDADAEASLFSMACSDALLSHSRCLFHAVALRCGGKAWLISAPPGVGKSSLYQALRQAHPEHVDIINGDRPLLALTTPGQVRVCPSPWNGKENWHGAPESPLGGILLLRRAEEDGLLPVRPGAAVLSCLTSLICTRLDETQIRLAAAFLDRVLELAPVYLLKDHALDAAAGLLWTELLAKEVGL